MYEKRGLLAPVGRNGLRGTYHPAALDRLARIACARGRWPRRKTPSCVPGLQARVRAVSGTVT
ncbi:hypothetical protein GCM10017786_26020 [Amycolatopsis deserti]|uniref:HTH merR-type domain-containing protein n=1 Tax=Amycolatopsis deserti TaxID=185696 RepID=A0ABQ3ISH4_9PSEU|nr:hypothetical protein GCM10017786_26020 [Amycolatopsis deserti]